nr:hypothetical protein [Candidatus Saccharibacteria bacterium]
KVMSGTMENMTQPIWQGWMNKAHDNIPAFDREKPAGLQTKPAYVIRSHVGIGSVEPSPSSDLFPSWYKNNNSTDNKPKTIDKVSNKLATECTPGLAKETINDASANAFSGDRFVGGAGSNSSDKDDVHKCDDAKPGISLNVSGSSPYNLSVNVTQGTHPINSDKFKGTVNYILDGQTIRSFNIDGPGSGLAAFTYTPDFTGSKAISAQIVDSVLYDTTSSSETITAGSSFTVTATQVTPTKYNFGWSSGGTGTITVYKSDGTPICSASALGSGCTGGPYTVVSISGAYAKDSTGKTVNVSGP